MPPHIRVNAGAVIVRDNRILLIEHKDDEIGLHYNLPGGGVDPGESIHEAALRETLEEASVHVTIQRLLFTWEYEPIRHDFKYGKRHKVGFVFHCELLPGEEPKLPKNPDRYQIGVQWVEMIHLDHIQLLPEIANPIRAALKGIVVPHIVI
ncbi:MAG: NUDIX domain-containing protein [Anaerolineae bacterium]|nr:NUDIX domain-containing protein [Anaerolineae bacterium]